jgi:hypothetical protein
MRRLLEKFMSMFDEQPKQAKYEREVNEYLERLRSSGAPAAATFQCPYEAMKLK